MIRLFRVIAIAALVAVAGCSAFAPKIETPKVTLVNVAMTSADIFSQQFRVKLHAQNPNDRDLPVKGLDYKLFLEGDSFAEGVSNTPFVIPALGETDFDITIKTNFVSSLGRLVSRLNGRTKVNYEIEGKVLTDLGMFNKIPFREAGTVDLQTMK